MFISQPYVQMLGREAALVNYIIFINLCLSSVFNRNSINVLDIKYFRFGDNCTFAGDFPVLRHLCLELGEEHPSGGKLVKRISNQLIALR